MRRAVFDLKFSEHAPEDLLPPTTMHQRAERLDDGTIRLTVDMTEENPLAEDDLPGTDPSYMETSIMIDHSDEEVQKLAQRVRERVGGAVDDLRFARSARRFVTRYMTGVNLATGDATASEVARSRSGDCTECSVLLAAILRAQGIPSRCVTGLAYADTEFAGQSDVFVYHMWTQAWITTIASTAGPLGRPRLGDVPLHRDAHHAGHQRDGRCERRVRDDRDGPDDERARDRRR